MYLLWPKGSAGSHQILVLVCVVTPTKSFRVVCGNAHPAYLVWAGLAHYSSQVERTDVFNDLLDKAQSELDDTRHAVSNAAHNFAMLKQSLVDQLAQDNKALEKAKADSLAAEKADLAEAERVWPPWRRNRPQATLAQPASCISVIMKSGAGAVRILSEK